MAQGASNQVRDYFDGQMSRGETYPVCGGEVAVFSTRCPGKETANEDAAAVIPFDADSAVLAVADGLGGGPSGRLASTLAIESLKASLDEGLRQSAMLRTAVLNGLEEANRAVQTLGTGAATTIAVVEVQGTSVRPYHVGDSMILVVGQRGKIKLQTTSHSPVGFAVEAGVLDEQEAMYHEDRHLVSNVVGTPEMKIEIGPTVSLAPRDTVLLASDGLFDNLHVDEIVERTRKGSLNVVTRRLADDSIRRMTLPDEDRPSKPDDLTFMLFRRRPDRGSAAGC
ncbi:MAG: PP2C family protein-serine/threonine phosphatase [Planctomycetota bacterium]|jgi:serine/threonine protein phosphatase PrpC